MGQQKFAAESCVTGKWAGAGRRSVSPGGLLLCGVLPQRLAAADDRGRGL